MMLRVTYVSVTIALTSLPYSSGWIYAEGRPAGQNKFLSFFLFCSVFVFCCNSRLRIFFFSLLASSRAFDGGLKVPRYQDRKDELTTSLGARSPDKHHPLPEITKRESTVGKSLTEGRQRFLGCLITPIYLEQGWLEFSSLRLVCIRTSSRMHHTRGRCRRALTLGIYGILDV